MDGAYIEDLESLEAVLDLVRHGEDGLGHSKFELLLVGVLELAVKLLKHCLLFNNRDYA